MSTDRCEYDEFKALLVNELTRVAEESGMSVSEQEQHRNGIALGCIVISAPHQDIGCVFFPGRIYERYLNGDDIETVAGTIIQRARSAQSHGAGILASIEAGKKRGNIFTAVCDLDSNRERLDHDGIPYRPLYDTGIAAYPRVRLPDGTSFAASRAITGGMYMTRDEILQLANGTLLTGGMELEPLESALAKLMNVPGPGGGDSMWYGPLVATTPYGSYGAAVISQKRFLDDIYASIHVSYVIIPFSVHSVVIIPDGLYETVHLNSMLRELNSSVVSPVDRLGGRILRYDSHVLSVASTEDGPAAMPHGIAQDMAGRQKGGQTNV